MGRLDDKVAIITGAGQGIGLAYARAVPRRGRQGRGRRARRGARRGRRWRTLEGKGDAIFVQTDISDPDVAPRRAPTTTKERVRTHRHPRQQRRALPRHRQRRHDYEYLQKVIEREPARRVAHGPGRARRRWSSSAGAGSSTSRPARRTRTCSRRWTSSTGSANFSYSITKWGIVGLTKFMAAQLGQYGITVNCIAPGVTMTEATKKIVPEMFIERHDRDDRDEADARARGPRRRRGVLRERRRQARAPARRSSSTAAWRCRPRSRLSTRGLGAHALERSLGSAPRRRGRGASPRTQSLSWPSVGPARS